MFLHGMGSGSCLSYTGLVLPEHTSPDSQRATGDIWFSKPATDDIWCIICQTDRSAGKLVRLSEPPCILHWSSFEYWCQWTIWQVVALVDNDMPLSLSSVSLSMKISISGKWCLFWAIRRQCFALPSFSSLLIFQLWYVLSFLSDPSPIFGYACHTLPNSLTHSVTFSKLDWCGPGM